MAGVNIGLTGEWRKAARILGTAPVRIRIAMDKAVLQEAHFFRNKVVQGIREQAPGGVAFKPLAETTLAMRRFQNFNATKALIVRGDLRNSVKVVKKSTPLGAEAFVGVLKSAKGKEGQPLVNIAEVHEFGSDPIVIEVTPAMRGFLAMVFEQELGEVGFGQGGFSTGIIVTQIPPRPYLRPVIDRYFDGPDAALRFQARVAANLGGLMGVVFGESKIRPNKSFFATFAQALKRSKGGPARDPVTGRFMSRGS